MTGGWLPLTGAELLGVPGEEPVQDTQKANEHRAKRQVTNLLASRKMPDPSFVRIKVIPYVD